MEKRNSTDSVIPVVFATNDAYAPYLGVAIYSLILHTTKQYEYKIYILTGDISKKHKNRIMELKKEKNNIAIEFIDVSHMMSNYKINIGSPHVTKETAYRLLIDCILPQYEKVIYLDCDLIVNHDVADLYQYNLGDNIAGACATKMPVYFEEYIDKELHICLEEYFNTGVMLFNIPAFAKEKIGKKGLDMLGKKTYAIQEQDVLNILCNGKMIYFDKRWNVRWGPLLPDTGFRDDAVEETERLMEEPYIVHFTTGKKAWSHPEYESAEYFWKYARQTVFYEEILSMNFKPVVSSTPLQDPFSRFLFPWNTVKSGSKIILYGGGVVGKTFLAQLDKTEYCKVLAICDQVPEKIKEVDVPVINIAGLENFSFDAIVIAIENKEVADHIYETLLERNIPAEKLLWSKPNRD